MVKKLLVLCCLTILNSFADSGLEFKSEKGFTASLPYVFGANYSVMGWVKLPEATSGSDCILGLGERNDGRSAFSLYYERDKGLGFTFYTGKGQAWKPIELKQNSWNHFAAAFNPKTKKTDLYINGVYTLSSIQSQFSRPVNPEAFKFSLGINLNRTEGLGNVCYDDFSVWSSPLTRLQIEQNYNFGSGNALSGNEENLVAYFDFNEVKENSVKGLKGVSGSINGKEGESFVRVKRLRGKSVLNEYVQNNGRVLWSLSSERGIEKYVVINSKTAGIIKVIKPGGADSYSIRVDEDVETQLLIVSPAGYQRSFSPSER